MFLYGWFLSEGNVFRSISAGKCIQVNIVRHFLSTNQNHLVLCKIKRHAHTEAIIVNLTLINMHHWLLVRPIRPQVHIISQNSKELILCQSHSYIHICLFMSVITTHLLNGSGS